MKHFIALLFAAVCSIGAYCQPVSPSRTVDTELSPIGIPLLYESYCNDKLQGRCIYRNENGCINRWGYYDADENFWGIEFTFNKDLSRKLADIQMFQRGQLVETTAGLQQTVIDSLLKVCRRFNDFADHPGLAQMRKDLKGDIDDFRNLISQNLKIERGNYLIYYLVSLTENYISLKMVEPQIDYYLTQIAAKNYPALAGTTNGLQSPLDLEHRTLHNFRDSLEMFYYQSFALADKLKKSLQTIRFSRQADSLLLRAINIVNEKYYTREFEVLYRQSLEPMVNQAKEFLRHENQPDSAAVYRLIGKFEPFIQHYKEVKTYEDSISFLLRTIRDLGASRQNSGTIAYLANVDLGLKPYFNEVLLEEKLKKGAQAVSMLREKHNEIQSLTKTESQIDSRIILIKKKYLDGQPEIFKTEILPLEQKIGAYKLEESLITKLQDGQFILQKINELDSHYDSLIAYDTLIDRNYKVLKASYLAKYPQIFYNDIKPLEQEINNYENEGVAESKISKAMQLLEGFRGFAGNLDHLIRQENHIDSAGKQAGMLYKQRFPKVYKSEYEAITADISAYKNMAFLVGRTEKGKDISLALKRMISRYDSLNLLDEVIGQHYQKVRKDYDRNFPGIYARQFVILEPRYKLYEESGISREKLNHATFISNKILLLEAEYLMLDSLRNQIEQTENQCRLLYDKNTENQVIWKKGKKLVAVYTNSFFNAAEKQTAEGYANDLFVLLNKMIRLSKKDNSFLKEALEKAKTPEEIRKSFGV